MLKRSTSSKRIGERENVAKKAVEEHKINGSLRSSSPKALLKAPAMHRKLFIVHSLLPCPNNLCAAKNGLQEAVSGRKPAFCVMAALSASLSISSCVRLPSQFNFYSWSKPQTLVNKLLKS
jgi:hypothetical protein